MRTAGAITRLTTMSGLVGLVGLCWISPVLAGQSATGEVKGVRLWAGPEATRVVLDVAEPTEYRLFTLQGPERVVIDLLPGELNTDQVAIPAGQGMVQAIRTANKPDGVLRVVLDLSKKTQASSFYAPPNSSYGHRLVIDLAEPSRANPVRKAPVPSDGGRDVVIAVDPGHGGDDPGATGGKGTREKMVVMQISRRLKALIDAQPGMRAVLIRDGDYFVPHRRRMALAREHNADLFVSVHADAFRDKRARGATVYTLSKRGASDEAARRLAERENASDLIGGVSLSDKDDVLASVLLDLSQNASLSASVEIGDRVVGELGQVVRVRKRKVQQARFLVLKSPDIPSILVETAYISNPAEERNLNSSAHQNKLAGAMFRAMRGYFTAFPPPDSYLALNRNTAPSEPIRHVIARGDTLSEIADRYNVPLGTLRRTNNLRSDRIRIGQVLQIPAAVRM